MILQAGAGIGCAFSSHSNTLGSPCSSPAATAPMSSTSTERASPALNYCLHCASLSPRRASVPLPDSAGNLEIALRTCIPPTSMFVANRGAWRIRIGTVAAMDEAQRAMLSERLNSTVPNVGIDLVVLLAGIPLLLLFWWQPDHREYLWLGLYLMSVATGDICYYLAMRGFVPFSVNWFGGDPNGYLATIAQIEFTFSFVGKRVTRAWRLYEALLLTVIITLQIPAWLGFVSRGLMNLAEVVLMVPASLSMLVLLLIWYRRGNRETGWLILPSILPVIGILVTDLGIAAEYLGWSGIAWISAPLHVGVLTLELFQLANLLFLLAIGFVMFFRFTRVSRDQARGAAELEAAQRVQALLLRSSQERVPGLTIETVYRPAQEVGGDFFHTAQEGEVMRVVIGDVSGKGLGAAMLVSAVVGALDTLHDSRPSWVLRTLNALLLARQQGGFATCVCACIAQDGAITFANAGHLAPYCNGEELPLESGLPLGIAAVAEYSETALPAPARRPPHFPLRRRRRSRNPQPASSSASTARRHQHPIRRSHRRRRPGLRPGRRHHRPHPHLRSRRGAHA